MSFVPSRPKQDYAAVTDGSCTPTVSVADVGTSCTDGVSSGGSSHGSARSTSRGSMAVGDISGGSCYGSARSVSPGKIAIDDVLLEYCTFNEDAVKRGTKPTANCKFCGFAFGNQTSFAKHLRKAHADLNIRPFKCNTCDYRAAVKGNLREHIKFHADVRPFKCSLCNKGFIHKYKLDLHLKFHENKREYECDECGHAFNDQHDLNRHKKNTHFSKETAVKCSTCDRLFKTQVHLDMHMPTHNGLKGFVCEVCFLKCSSQDSLRSHVKRHKFEFVCKICSKTLYTHSSFITTSAHSTHKRQHDPSNEGYLCDVCGKAFKVRASLVSHMACEHTTERPFKCDQCPKAFKTTCRLTVSLPTPACTRNSHS